jgi:hypothetical protein
MAVVLSHISVAFVPRQPRRGRASQRTRELQAGAEIAYARYEGWDDWTPDEETEPGIVRSARVQYHADPDEGMIVWDDDPDDMRYVLVTGGRTSTSSSAGSRWGTRRSVD